MEPDLSDLSDMVSNPMQKRIEQEPQKEDLLSSVNSAEFSGAEVKEKDIPFFSVW